MKSTDKDFNLQQIEDRAGVIFWMNRLSERTQSVEPMQRFSTEAFCEHHHEISQERGYTYMENVAFASASLKGFKISKHWDSLFILVVWSGVPVTLNSAGQVLAKERTSRIMREIYVLGRRHGVKTNLNNTLSSAHCPECGAPLSSAFAVTCNYCNTVLNEGSNSWILERITNENDPSYLEVIANKAANETDFAEDDATRSARDVVTIMAQILLADGKVEPSEMQLLNKIAQHYEISETQVEAIINSLKEGLIYIPSPTDNRESWSLLLAAARMALADGNISPDEERELVLLAQHIGYCAADVTRAIKAEEKRRFEEERAIKYRINREKLNLELAKNKASEPEDPGNSP